MELLIVVTMLAVAQYLAFGLLVGRARVRHGVKAPAVAGHPEFDRCFRVHQNTLELLVAFLPALWAFGLMIDALYAAVLGLGFIAGRFVYARAYIADPARRGIGMVVSLASISLLIAGGLIGAALRLRGA